MTKETDTPSEVRAALARAGHNRTWLAEQLGVTTMWVSRRLSGQTPITVADLQRIARILDVPVASLLPTEEASA